MSIGEVQRQSIASFVGQISFTFIGFLSTMYFAHTVGASILGAYFLFTAYYGIINMITDGGFGGAAIKRISEGEEQDAYFSAFFVLRSLFVVVVVSTLIGFRNYFIEFDDAGIFSWLLLALIASLFHGSVTSGVAGTGKMGVHAAGHLVNNISRIVIQVAAVFLGFGVAGLAGGFVAGLFIAAIIELRFFDLHFVRFEWWHVKSLSSFSFWLFLTSAGVILYSYVDTIMIDYYLSNSDVGIYRVVFQFASLATLATVAIRTTLWPKVSRWGKLEEIEFIEESLSRAFTYSLTLAIPVFVGGILFGDKLLYFFYGADFERGYLTLVILLFVQIVNIFHYFFTMYLGALNHQKDSFKVTAVSTAANIALNLILIPIIGIEGAACATLVTMGLSAILARNILSQIINIKIDNGSIFNILKAVFFMSIIVGCYRLLIPLSNVLLTLIPVLLGALIYGILILKFDVKMHDQFKEIATKMKIPWSSLL
ncbi:Membrane protein involved in the export of O-antigen and teichoic acid [Methanococcoides vulcani]|uniref:Membrane protein involved in the export of O-antigen and teichoic acid n=1 Tax=Methanococcoides vulcani TaxID=1353158 RepID=A0A1I0ARG5_9EURY|nr:flippase [Methanococcoides vulcani]SES96081.1 Membrane protein involved in the export of O-antigen and teichoic acid [Methanococcoides vulcani]